MPTCFWILVVSSPTCFRWKRGPVGHFFGQVPQRSGQLSIGKLTCQNLRQYTVNTNLRPNGHTRAYSPGKQNWLSNRGPLPKPTTKNQKTSNRLTQSQPFHVHPNQQTTSNRPTKTLGVVVTMPEQPGRDASENLVHWRPQNQGPKTQWIPGSPKWASPLQVQNFKFNWGGPPWRDRFC